MGWEGMLAGRCTVPLILILFAHQISAQLGLFLCTNYNPRDRDMDRESGRDVALLIATVVRCEMCLRNGGTSLRRCDEDMIIITGLSLLVIFWCHALPVEEERERVLSLIIEQLVSQIESSNRNNFRRRNSQKPFGRIRPG